MRDSGDLTAHQANVIVLEICKKSLQQTKEVILNESKFIDTPLPPDEKKLFLAAIENQLQRINENIRFAMRQL